VALGLLGRHALPGAGVHLDLQEDLVTFLGDRFDASHLGDRCAELRRGRGEEGGEGEEHAETRGDAVDTPEDTAIPGCVERAGGLGRRAGVAEIFVL
jgi:hypothetical protein